MVDPNLDDENGTYTSSDEEINKDTTDETNPEELSGAGGINSPRGQAVIKNFLGYDVSPSDFGIGSKKEDPAPEEVPLEEEPLKAPEPKTPEKSVFLEADAFNILNKSPSFEEGVAELQKKYDSHEWDDPQLAKSTLADYGRLMRQKFQVQPSPPKDTYRLAPINPDTITSPEEDPINNRLDRVARWRDANLKALDETDDPNQLALKDHLIRSINQTALTAEQSIRKEYRDEHWYRFGYLKDKAARLGEAIIDPLYKAIEGEEYTGLQGQIDPTRNEEVTSKLTSAVGSVVAPVVAGAAVGLATGGTGVLPYLAATGAAAIQGVGSVRGTYNLVEEETGSLDKAFTAGEIEAASQVLQLAPIGKLAGGAGKTLGALRTSFQTKVAEDVIGATLKEEAGKSILKSAAVGFALEAPTEAIGQIISNKAIAVGLSQNDPNLFAGVKDSFIYGGIVGAGLGAIEGLGHERPQGPTPELLAEDTALAAAQAENEGARRDINRIVTGIDQEEGPRNTPEQLRELFPDPFTQERKSPGVRILRDSEGDIVGSQEGMETVIPDHILAQEFSNPDASEGSPDHENYNGIQLSHDEMFKSQSQGDRLDQQQSPNSEQSPNFKKFFVSENLDKSRKDLGEGGSPVRVANMLITGNLHNNPTFIKFLKNHIGVGGYEVPLKKLVFVPRSLFSNPEQATMTLNHELGHFIDIANDFASTISDEEAVKLGVNKTLLQKLSRAKRQIPGLVSNEKAVQVENQARALSKWWRSGWDGSDQTSYGKYRSDPNEVFADVFSAMMMRPDVLQDHYKQLWRVLDKGFSNDTDTSETWNFLKDAWKNPLMVDELAINQQNFRSRQRGYEIEQEARDKEAAARPTFRRQVVGEADRLYHSLINKVAQVTRIAVKQKDPAIRDELFQLHENVTSPSNFKVALDTHLHTPIANALNIAKNLMAKVEVKYADGRTAFGVQESEAVNDLSEYERNIKIINDKTPAMARIATDPKKYSSFIQNFFLEEGPRTPYDKSKYGIAKYLPEDYKAQLREAVRTNNPEQIMDLFAQFDHVIRGLRPPLPKELQAKIDAGYARAKTPDGQARVRAQEARIKDRYDRSFDQRNTTPMVEEIHDKLKRAVRLAPSSFGEVVKDLITPNSFNARRYLANAQGDTVQDANSRLQYLKNKYGNNFSVIENFSKSFHQAVNSFLPVIERSGIFKPEQIERMKLNKDSYTTNLVLAYFEGNDSIDSKVRAAVGSLQETGDELGATILKMSAIAERATMQDATNSMVKMAALNNNTIEVVKAQDPRTMWIERDKLNNESKDASYHIITNAGVASLVKINDGYNFRYALQRPSDIPGLTQAGQLLEAFNKTLQIREIKTVYNPAFVFFQKFYDFGNTALQMMIRTGDVFHPLRTIRETRKLIKESNADIVQALRDGTFRSEEVKDAFNRGLFPNSLKAYLGEDERPLPTDEIIAAAYDRAYKPGTTYTERLDRLHDKAGDYIENTVGLKQFKAGADWFKEMAEKDELRTKLVGYKLGLKLGMGKAEALWFGRSTFGVPDPTGGGVQAPLINKFFLFGRAHLNGLRSLGRLASENPKNAGLAFLTYVVLPKLFVSTAAPALIGGVFGEEAEKVYAKWLDKVPSFEKLGKMILPIGFMDDHGAFKGFGEQTADQIGDTWKAYYIRIPQERMITDMSRIAWPLIDDLLKGNVGGAISGSVTGAGQALSANLNPGIQYLSNIAALVQGNNPEDFFRGKPIIPSDVFKAGNPLDIASEYGQYLGGQILPQVIPYNPYQTKDAKSIYDEVQRAPVAGPLTRSFIGATNYGQYEVQKEEVAKNEAERASLRINLDEDSKSLYSEYRSVAANIRAYGKDWVKQYNKEELPKAKAVYRWQKTMSEYAKNIKMAEDRGDEGQAEYWRNGLAKLSKHVKEVLEPEEESSKKSGD